MLRFDSKISKQHTINQIDYPYEVIVNIYILGGNKRLNLVYLKKYFRYPARILIIASLALNA